MREGDWMSWGELQREQMTDEDKEIALWVSDKMPQLVKDLTRICRIPSVAVVPEDKKPPYGPECVRVLDDMLQIGKEYGLDTKNFDSCVGRIRYGDGEKSIGIWSHLDVVPVGGYWEHDLFSLVQSVQSSNPITSCRVIHPINPMSFTSYLLVSIFLFDQTPHG